MAFPNFAGGCTAPSIWPRDNPFIDIIFNSRRDPPVPQHLPRSPSSSSTNIDSSLSDLFSSDTDSSSSDDEQERRDYEAAQARRQEKVEGELQQCRQEIATLIKSVDDLNDKLNKQKIETFEQLATQNQQSEAALIQLAAQTTPMAMQGRNIGLLGKTSTGKSTMVNSLLGEKRADVGYGETTLKVTSYQGSGYVIFDFPGRNDETSYFSMEYISLLKGFSSILILIENTIKEISSLMKLLDEIGVRYEIVVNKFDRLDDDERPQFMAQIQSEVQTAGLRNVNKVYFVSAKRPNLFPDWLQMVHALLQ